MTNWTYPNRARTPIKLLIDSTYKLIIEPSTNHELLLEDFQIVTDWTFQNKN